METISEKVERLKNERYLAGYSAGVKVRNLAGASVMWVPDACKNPDFARGYRHGVLGSPDAEK